MGYHRAGFNDITGVDIKPQPHYPFKFIQGDALEYLAEHGTEYDFIHASPPCQRYSLGSTRWDGIEYRPHLLPETEIKLLNLGIPFVVENVERAPFMLPTITLCGIQFKLNVIRHRKFSSNILLLGVPHLWKHPDRGDFVTCAGHGGNGSNKYSTWCRAMGIDWMTKGELAEAIPPDYTEYIGRQFLDGVR